MRLKLSVLTRLALALLLLAPPAATAQLVSPNSFTYQGHLLQDGQPYTGTADVQFTLVRSPSIGSSTVPIVRMVDVVNGTFTTTLDFGPELIAYSVDLIVDAGFPALNISVRTPAGSANPFVPITPTQTITPAPTALGLVGFSRQSPFTTDVSQLVEDTTFQINANVVQTFVPTRFGALESVFIRFTNTGAATPVTLTVRTNTVILGTSTATVPAGGGLIRFPFPVGVNIGTGSATRLDFNTTTTLGVRYASTNPYAAGSANFLANADIVFAVNLRDTGSWLSTAPIEIRGTTPNTLAAISTSSTGSSFLLSALGTSGQTFSLTSTAASSPDGPGLLRIQPQFGPASSGLSMDASGRVGINKVTPSANLHVGGSLAVDGAVSLPATTRQYTVAALACSTIGSTSGLTTSGTGSVAGTTAGQTVSLIAPVNLPHGAVITKLRFSILDNAAEDVSVSLVSGLATAASSITLKSATTSGAVNAFLQTTLDITPAPAPVDNVSRFYFIRVQWTCPAVTSTIAVRSLGVEYTVTSPLP